MCAADETTKTSVLAGHGPDFQRAVYVAFLRQQIGLPYRWGGQGPDAYDCSGLVLGGLEMAEILGRDRRYTAADLYHWCVGGHGRARPKPDAIGQLVFYGRHSGAVEHVMSVLCLWGDKGFSVVGARGGDATTLDISDALARGAMVAVEPGTYWQSGIQGIFDPFAA